MDRDAIVVGGGPVGAAVARALAGLGVALLAPQPRTAAPAAAGRFDARVYALGPGNVQFLEEIGAPLQARATPVYQMRIFGDAGARLEFDAYRAGLPVLAWIVEDRVLQEALWRELPAEVVAPAQPESLTVENERARVRLADGRELSARLVVGADGARSFVRQHAGIAAQEKAYGQSGLVANFACERAHRGTAWQWFQRTPEGGAVLALLPLPGEHVSMVWSLPAHEAERLQALDAPSLCRAVEAATHGVLGALELVTPAASYPLRRLSARRLVAPRIALAGDAAHVIHPLAGQGLNLGLQDVRELRAALLEPRVARDPGELSVLRRYERARAEPILAMDGMVDGLYRLFGARSDVAARLANAGLNLADRLPVLKNLLIRHASS